MSANMGSSLITNRGQHLTMIKCSTAMGINNVQFSVKALLGSLQLDLPALQDPVDLLGRVTLANVSFPPSERNRAVNAGRRTRHPALISLLQPQEGGKGRPGCVWLIDLVCSLSDNIWKQDIYISFLFLFFWPPSFSVGFCCQVCFSAPKEKKNKKKNSIFPQYCLSASLHSFF